MATVGGAGWHGGAGWRARGVGSGGIRRFLATTAFLPAASRAPLYARLVWALLGDARVPVARKGLLGLALGYLVLGRDLVPDEVPVIGGLDDLLVVVLAVELFFDGVPEEVLREALERAGIERAAFEADVARIRRLVPGVVRRTIKRLSTAIDLGGRAWREGRLGPRLRTQR